MSFTDTEVDLIRSSFRLVDVDKDAAGALFYKTLFEIAPETQDMFSSDLTRQGAKLMTTLAVIVANLKNFAQILPDVEELAHKHVGYGVKPRHYAVVGQALDTTLSRALGDGYTIEMRAAWLKAYDAVSSVMITAAYVDAAA